MSLSSTYVTCVRGVNVLDYTIVNIEIQVIYFKTHFNIVVYV